MSGERELTTVLKQFQKPAEDIARRGRKTAATGRVRDDGLCKGPAFLSGPSDAFDVQVYGWRQGGSVDEIMIHETILWAGVLRGTSILSGLDPPVILERSRGPSAKNSGIAEVIAEGNLH